MFNMSKANSYLLSKIPDDIRQFLIKEQAKHKLNTGLTQFSLEQTMYKLLRDYIRCREENNFKP